MNWNTKSGLLITSGAGCVVLSLLLLINALPNSFSFILILTFPLSGTGGILLAVGIARQNGLTTLKSRLLMVGAASVSVYLLLLARKMILHLSDIEHTLVTGVPIAVGVGIFCTIIAHTVIYAKDWLNTEDSLTEATYSR